MDGKASDDVLQKIPESTNYSGKKSEVYVYIVPDTGQRCAVGPLYPPVKYLWSNMKRRGYGLEPVRERKRNRFT